MRGKVIKGSASRIEPFTVGLPVPPAAVAATTAADAAAGLAALDFNSLGAGSDLGDAAPPAPSAELENAHAAAAEILDDAHAQASAIVDAANATAARTVADARDEAARVVEAARRSAHDEGFAAGTHAAEEEYREMLDALHELLESVRAERRSYIESAEPEVLRLAFGIAERVLHQQVALDATVVVEMAKAAIARVVDREKMTIRVNPADVARMRTHRDELLALGDVKSLRVIEDQRVDRGGVVLETDAGSIDARVSTQIAEVRKILQLVDDVVITAAESDEPAADTARAS